MRVVLVAAAVVAVILIIGTILTGQSARNATDEAVRAVSRFYLDELAGRREQVVEDSLADNIQKIQVAISLMTEEDLSNIPRRQAYQTRMKKLFDLEKFAFVDETGYVYTSTGQPTDIDDYSFDYRTLSGPDISVRNLNGEDKKVVIAVPAGDLPHLGHTLKVCFMEVDMDVMLEKLSMQTGSNGVTFSNLYTADGIALSNAVLGGLAVEDNLLDAMATAEYDEGYSLEKLTEDFQNGTRGLVSFTYNGIQETLDYVPVPGTDWMLTYLIRESVISDQISGISEGIVRGSLIQSLVTALVLFGLFAIIVRQTRRSAQLAVEKEAQEAANRAKQEELEQRLALQEQLLEQEKQQHRQGNLITALSSDYRSVYYLELDRDEGTCYQSRTDLDGLKTGDKFRYLEAVTNYCNTYVMEPFREEFLRFIQPDNVREGLKNNLVISYRYMIDVNGKESWETVKFAGVRHPEDRADHLVHTVGACFADVDEETRQSLAQTQMLSDALSAAEEASKAKTVFLSNMSHEIRTPMNAIIGLDNIALNDETLSPETRSHLEKINGSAQHLLGLINDILDMSRIESGRLVLKNEEFSISHLLEQINTMISSQCGDKGLEYHCRVNGQLADYYIGDATKLRQVILNILGNAVKFTPEGGSVEFEVEPVANFDGKTTLRMIMKDTGIGMDEDFLPHLFEAFSQEDSSSTNRYGSTGLGMAITKSIVEMMNGRIDVASEKGKGSKFTVTVTLQDSDRHDAEGQKTIDPGSMTVLVIDDDPIACEHARLVLEKVGIAAEIAQSGEEAVEMVRLRHARRDPYNLILVDWKMPGMDGVEATRQIRDVVGRESAIIILTAYKWDDVLEEAVQAGVDSFLAKPLFATNVLEEFTTAMKKRGLADDLAAKKADLKGRRVLMAEDVAINAEIITMLLGMKEVEVDHAENGLVALEKFEDSEDGWYDAVLMDMRMPEMDGLTAAAAIRALERPDAKTVPIIALTANAFDEDVQQSLQAGMNAHLSKPVEPQHLYDTLAELIGEREG